MIEINTVVSCDNIEEEKAVLKIFEDHGDIRKSRLPICLDDTRENKISYKYKGENKCSDFDKKNFYELIGYKTIPAKKFISIYGISKKQKIIYNIEEIKKKKDILNKRLAHYYEMLINE